MVTVAFAKSVMPLICYGNDGLVVNADAVKKIMATTLTTEF